MQGLSRFRKLQKKIVLDALGEPTRYRANTKSKVFSDSYSRVLNLQTLPPPNDPATGYPASLQSSSTGKLLWMMDYDGVP